MPLSAFSKLYLGMSQTLLDPSKLNALIILLCQNINWFVFFCYISGLGRP